MTRTRATWRLAAAFVVAFLAVASCTRAAPSQDEQTSPTAGPPISQPTPRTVVIGQGGAHTYVQAKIAPGDTVKCLAGGVGGVVPDHGQGVEASSGFRAWTDAAGIVHVTCPQHGEIASV
jgi:hypothetical protein